MRVGGAEDAFVAAGSGEAELAGTGYAAGWAEEFWSWGALVENAIRENGVPGGLLGLVEVAEEVGFGVE